MKGALAVDCSLGRAAARPIIREGRLHQRIHSLGSRRSYASYTSSPASISSEAEIQSARNYCIDILRSVDDVLVRSSEADLDTENTIPPPVCSRHIYHPMLEMPTSPFAPSMWTWLERQTRPAHLLLDRCDYNSNVTL